MARINLVERAQQKSQQHIRQGATVIDATAGNGHDTLMLAKAVGEQGMVFAFDIQHEALTETANRLTESGVINRVKLIEASHANMVNLIPKVQHSNISLVMFNLGYLPGSDKNVITDGKSTLTALDAALALLSTDSAVSVIAYPGHSGGDSECDLVSKWCDDLDVAKYQIEKVIPETVKRKPPQWFWISRV